MLLSKSLGHTTDLQQSQHPSKMDIEETSLLKVLFCFSVGFLLLSFLGMAFMTSGWIGEAGIHWYNVISRLG